MKKRYIKKNSYNIYKKEQIQKVNSIKKKI